MVDDDFVSTDSTYNQVSRTSQWASSLANVLLHWEYVRLVVELHLTSGAMSNDALCSVHRMLKWSCYESEIGAAGWILHASDAVPHKPYPGNGNMVDDMRRSVFCLAPTGQGWGVRLKQAIFAGCIPVVVADHVQVTRTWLWDFYAWFLSLDHSSRLPCPVFLVPAPLRQSYPLSML